jgi:hypothetical protein
VRRRAPAAAVGTALARLRRNVRVRPGRSQRRDARGRRAAPRPAERPGPVICLDADW